LRALVMSRCSQYCCYYKPFNFWQDIHFTLPYYSSKQLILYRIWWFCLFLKEIEEKNVDPEPCQIKEPHSLYAMASVPIENHWICLFFWNNS
jgi:hypothetical protein